MAIEPAVYSAVILFGNEKVHVSYSLGTMSFRILDKYMGIWQNKGLFSKT